MAELGTLVTVLRHYPQVQRGVLFGSRAKGTARPNSDIDLALYGDLDDMVVERIAHAMDELPLPYLFDVKAVTTLKNQALIDHIERIGIEIYPPPYSFSLFQEEMARAEGQIELIKDLLLREPGL